MATVLVVDDRQVNRDLVRTVLGYHGHDTLEAAGGPEALDIVRAKRPDLVVADVLMPGMDGYQLARAIRSDPDSRGIPVLFYTANYVEEEIRPIASALGVDRVVTKGGDLTELLDAINDTLGTTPPPLDEVPDETFDREHLRVLNDKLIEKIGELEEAARLHQMVDAIVAVGDDLSQPAMLRRVAGAAHSLVSAQLTTLLTSGGEGRAAECIRLGTAVATEEPTAMSTAQLAALGALAVPIRIGTESFGQLTVVPDPGATFSAADEHLLSTLARAAGVAIANSQLYDDARRRQAWLAASADVASTLLVSDPAQALHLVAAGARRVVGAELAWIEVADGEEVSIGASDGVRGAVDGRLPLAQAALYGDIATTGQPVVVDDAAGDERIRAVLPLDALRIGPLLGVPLLASGRSLGVLFIGNERGGAPFSALDVEMARAFASRSAVTLEFARAEDDRARIVLLEDRNRIARDLHDVVIQRLFGLGLRLERVRSQLPAGPGSQLAEISDGLDRTIDEIRNTIFSLRMSGQAQHSLRAELRRIIEPTSFMLTFAPRLYVEGPVDTAVPARVVPHLLATLSEALANIVRHAAASSATVLVRVSGHELTLRVSDDGCGMPAQFLLSGLANLRRRATDLGGTMLVEPVRGGHGTVLTWTVPLVEAAPLLPEVHPGRLGPASAS